MRFLVLLVTSICVLSCAEKPYRDEKDFIVKAPERNTVPVVMGGEEKKKKEKKEEPAEEGLSESWPKIHISVNPSGYHPEKTPEDLSSSWSLLDVVNAYKTPGLRDGYVFAHAVVANLEDKPVEIILPTITPWIEFGTKFLAVPKDGTCTLREKKKGRGIFARDHVKSKSFIKVYDYQNNTESSEEIKILSYPTAARSKTGIK